MGNESPRRLFVQTLITNIIKKECVVARCKRISISIETLSFGIIIVKYIPREKISIPLIFLFNFTLQLHNLINTKILDLMTRCEESIGNPKFSEVWR